MNAKVSPTKWSSSLRLKARETKKGNVVLTIKEAHTGEKFKTKLKKNASNNWQRTIPFHGGIRLRAWKTQEGVSVQFT